MGLLLDFRYALRNIVKSLRFSLLMIFIMVGSLTISLIGFNFIHTIAFSHSSFNHSKEDIRILKVWNSLTSQREFTYSMLDGFKKLDEVNSLESWITIKRSSLWLSTQHYGKHFRASYVDPSFFKFLGQEPVIGRGFTNVDYSNNAPDVVVISHIVWQQLFQGDSAILGKQLNVAGKPHTIVGVMEKRNHFPIFSKIWLPLKQANMKPDDGIDILYKLPNAEFERTFEIQIAHYFYNTIKDQVSDSDKQTGQGVRIESLTLVELNTDGEAVFVFGLFVFGIVIVLFISGVNIGNLLFAKIMEKQKESAIRAAIGATQKRVIQQHVTEGLIYCIVSWVFALIFTSLGLEILNFYMNVMFGGKMPYWWYWHLNGQTVLVSLLLLAIIFTFAVLLPAYKSAKFNISNVLRDGTRGATGKETTLMSRRLLCVQVSLVSFLLMIASTVGYVMYSIATNIDGELSKGVYSVYLDFDNNDELTNDEQLTLINTLAAGLSKQGNIIDAVVFDSHIHADVLYPNGDVYNEKFISISAESHLFERELLTGRNFNSNDNSESKPVVIISESLANALFGNQNVIGSQLMLQDAMWPSAEIIGVAKDEISGVSGDSRHELYFSLRQTHFMDDSVNIRLLTNNTANEALEDFYRVKMQLSHDLTMYYMFDHYDNHTSMINSFAAIIYVFLLVGGFALTLSLIGIYAMGISNINKSRYEIGIRRAIGAKDSQIMRLFIKKNITHILYGIGTSLLVFGILCYLAESFLRGNVPINIMLEAGALTVVVVLAAVCLALYVPVRHVIKQQPATSLRMD